jgi:DNA-binding MarR family transcriptional regulator
MIQQERTHGAERLTEASEVVMAIGRVIRLLRRTGDAGSLGPGSASALGTLVRTGPMRLGDLAAAEQVTAPTMSRIVAGLEKFGYLQRTPDPADGRAHVLTATEPARALVNGFTSARVQHFADVLDKLDADERTAFVGALTKLVDLLDD